MKLAIRAALIVVTSLSLSGCDKSEKNDRSVEGFSEYVKKGPIGTAKDYWITMYNNYGMWEKVSLVFGYGSAEGTKIECENMISALKKINYLREYQCEIAN